MAELRLLGPPRAAGVRAARGRFVGDDHAMVAGIRRGDEAAASAMFERYEALVERTLTRVLGFDSELADTVQETFIRALSSTRLIRDPAALPSWLMRVAVCTARDLLRKRGRTRWLRFLIGPRELAENASEFGLETEIDLEGREALMAARAVLAKLPIEERLAFGLRRFEGLDLKNTAEACGCSLATVKRRLARGEARFTLEAARFPALARWLGEEGGEA